MKAVFQKIKAKSRKVSLRTGHKSYSENEYGKTARITDQSYRERLTSWQIPAIQAHFGDLTDKVFLDIGAGDIVLGDKLEEVGHPKIFYAQDLSRPSLNSGLKRITGSTQDSAPFVTMSSDSFDFSEIPDSSVDCAFSNSLFSHLSVNSIALCLRNLAPKMVPGGKYLSSMIIHPGDDDTNAYDWSYLGTEGSQVVSYFNKDPFHYSLASLESLSELRTNFSIVKVHDYGHPFQKLVEFRPQQL